MSHHRLLFLFKVFFYNFPITQQKKRPTFDLVSVFSVGYGTKLKLSSKIKPTLKSPVANKVCISFYH